MAKAKSKIVSAVGSISISASAVASGGAASSAVSVMVQAAMSEAVAACYAVGVHDPDIVRATMMAARDRVKNVEGAVNGAMISEYRACDAEGCEPGERAERVMAAGIAARAEAEARFPAVTAPVEV